MNEMLEDFLIRVARKMEASEDRELLLQISNILSEYNIQDTIDLKNFLGEGSYE